MSNSEHPFDKAARSLHAANEQVVSSQTPSVDYWELKFPLCEKTETGRQAHFDVADPSRSKATLQPSCDWTDALSSNAGRDAYLVNEAMLAVLQRFNLGNHSVSPVVVTDVYGQSAGYTKLTIDNQLDPHVIDFQNSDFYFTDIIGLPLGPVRINSFEDWIETFDNAQAGKIENFDEFTSIAHKKIVLRADSLPVVDIFSFQRLTIDVYVSSELKDAIETHGVTGFDLRPTRRLFAPNSK